MTRALLAATLFLFAGSAYAADMPLKAPPAAPPAPTWTGWYIGINGGGGWGSVKTGNASDVGARSRFSRWCECPGRGRGRVQGLPYVGRIGGRPSRLPVPGGSGSGHRRPGCRLRLVRSQGIRQQRLHPLPRHGTHRLQLESERQIAVTLHRSHASRPRHGNVVSLRQRRRFGHPSELHRQLPSIRSIHPFRTTRSAARTRPVRVIGGGAEVRFADHWLLRGEYLHTEFGSITGFGPIACTAGVGNCVGAGFRTTFQFSSRFTEDVGRVALSYKF